MSVLSSPPQESIVDALHKLRDAVIIAVAAVVITVAGASYFVVHTEKTGGKTLSKIGGISDQLTGKLADKDATIKAKDAQITELGTQVLARDNAIAGQTTIIGQLYNSAVALQQQVTSLGGQARTIPITLPTQPTRISPAPPRSPAAVSTPPHAAAASGAVPTPSVSPAVNLQIQCPIVCPQGR